MKLFTKIKIENRNYAMYPLWTRFKMWWNRKKAMKHDPLPVIAETEEPVFVPNDCKIEHWDLEGKYRYIAEQGNPIICKHYSATGKEIERPFPEPVDAYEIPIRHT